MAKYRKQRSPQSSSKTSRPPVSTGTFAHVRAVSTGVIGQISSLVTIFRQQIFCFLTLLYVRLPQTKAAETSVWVTQGLGTAGDIVEIGSWDPDRVALFSANLRRMLLRETRQVPAPSRDLKVLQGYWERATKPPLGKSMLGCDRWAIKDIEALLRALSQTTVTMAGYPAGLPDDLRRLNMILEAGRERVKLLYNEHLAARSAHSTTSAPRSLPSGSNSSAFLRLPLSLRKCVYRELLTSVCGLGFFVGDMTAEASSSRKKQTVYSHPSYKSYAKLSHANCAYYVTDSLDEITPKNIHLNILCVNRQIHYEASEILYEQPFTFVGSTKAAIAFLRDRSFVPSKHVKAKISMMTRLKARYRTRAAERCVGMRGALDTVEMTTVPEWRLLHNIMVHQCCGLKAYYLQLDQDSWETVPWRKLDPETMIAVRGLLETSSPTHSRGYNRFGLLSKRIPEKRNFLQHAARFNPRVRLIIEMPSSIKDLDAVVYAVKLSHAMQAKISERPTLLSEKRCTCQTRQLEDCCFYKSETKMTQRLPTPPNPQREPVAAVLLSPWVHGVFE